MVTAALTTPVYLTLEVTLVDVTWSVVPTTIQDQYTIQITQTFSTNVPVPVLVTEPPSVTIPELQPGQTFNGEFTVKNYGLITADHVKVNYPASFLDYDIEILASAIPNTIPAMGSITVPYKITKRTATVKLIEPGAWGTVEGLLALTSEFDTHYELLLAEVQGYGAGCVTSTGATVSGDYTQCPNTPQQTTGNASTGFQFGFQQTCPGGTAGGGYVYTGGGTGYGSGVGSGGQGSGGGWPTISSDLITNTTNPCECVSDGSVAKDGERCCSGGQPMSNSISDLSACPNRTDKAGYAQGSHHNGCGSSWNNAIVPDEPMAGVSFLDACNAHDDGYDTCNSGSGHKNSVDTTFCTTMRNICIMHFNQFDPRRETCLTRASIYCWAVTNLGQGAYNDGQKDSCGCCKP